jgi:outer membrane protein OmpA-like peptidoglycan-associated protein
MSILDAARSLVTPDLVARLSAQTDESDSAVSRGLGAIIPMLLAAVSGRADDTTFMDQFASLAARSTDVDPSRPDVLTTMTDAASTTSANNWLASLFGDRLPSMLTDLSRYAGIKSSTATSLLTYAVPLIFGLFGRMMRRDNLNAGGLAAMLKSERDSYTAAVPAELAAHIPGVSAKPAPVTAMDDDVANEDLAGMVESSLPRASWVTPLVVGALSFAALIWFIGYEQTQHPTQRAGTATSSAVGTSGKVEAPGYVSPPAPPTGYATESQPAKNTSFDPIAFGAGSSSLMPASQDEIRDIATTLRQNPYARATISGYSDKSRNNTTDMALSQSRADAVVMALAKEGVSADQIRTEAHGNADPIASNDTAGGRALNRRVTIAIADSR